MEFKNKKYNNKSNDYFILKRRLPKNIIRFIKKNISFRIY